MVPKQRKILHFTSTILLNFTLLILVSSNPDTTSHHTEFIYKKCQNVTHLPQKLASSLIQELVEKSSNSKFYQTTTGDDTFAISGAFECRHDLTNTDCNNCIVNTLPRLSCGSDFLSRVQLKGCYISLEPEPNIPDPEGDRIDERVLIGFQKDDLQHKKCGERRVGLEGLEEVRDAAFEAIARCIISSGDKHCEMSHEWMHVVAQCDMSLEGCQCGKCVSNAFQVAQDECLGSDSGEVYLTNCFISFSDDNGGGNYSQGRNIGGSSAKVVAMVVGIGVALALLFALCYCIRSSKRKRGDDW
ncbi:unnamed protein product [Lactuca saligna]|uniref:Gnk2-homologous domain-containing protein n=1 Tax=Lactuca saligna TaxID=75948 RepID=A0AA35ZZX4_LACSI|nr:unnamed protein product [Lactuca saligna]